MFSAVIGRSYSPNVISPPSFPFQRRPISFNASKALSSISPSRLGDTLRMKVQYALLKGIRFSLTIHSGDFTSVVGKSLFQNHDEFSGRHDKAGIPVGVFGNVLSGILFEGLDVGVEQCVLWVFGRVQVHDEAVRLELFDEVIDVVERDFFV